MQTLVTKNFERKIQGVSIPNSLKPEKLIYSPAESDAFKDFIASQHPLINVWLVFSLISIGILSVLLYII